jgi:hypothetical protein
LSVRPARRRGRRSATAARMPLGHQVQRVAQVQAGNRTAGCFQFAFVAAGEGEGRAMQLFLDAAGEDADHALVPAGVEQAQAGAVAGIYRGQQEVRVVAHAGFDAAPLAVQASSCWAMFSARPGSSVIRHSMPSDMSASRPAAFRRGPRAKPRSKVAARPVRGRRQRNSAAAGLHLAAADARQALGDEDAVVAVERHHVGHGAERHEVEQGGEVRVPACPQRRRAGAVRHAAPA